MIRYHLTITIFNPFFQWKLNSRWKIDSVRFADYDVLFWKILSCLTYSEIQKLRFNLFEWYKYQLSCLNVSQFINGDVLEWYSIVSQDFNVPSHVIACCIPSRKIRDQYFEYDCIKEKYHVKSNFLFHITSK
jgi:hypothetical protein